MATDYSKWVIPALSAAATGYAAYSASHNARRDREQASEENDLDRRYNAAVRESELNPYRHHLAQAQSLGALDLIARSKYSAPTIDVPGVQAPTISGGFEYTPNPDMAVAAQRLQQTVASGQGAPSMTDPNNWGQTGAVNLNAAGGGAPRSGMAVPRAQASGAPGVSMPGGTGGRPSDALTMLAATPRRNEGAGGVVGGAGKGALAMSRFGPWAAAGGAVVGGAIGAMTKNAKTAKTDVSVDQARTLIAQAIQQAEGRSASPDEITEILRGQGWQPGHRWVGEKGITDVLLAIQSNGARAAGGADLAPSYDGLFR